MKKQILLIAILFCTAFAQAQEVFVTADFVSSYIWRGMDSGNASVQPSLGLNWKGLTVYAWGSTEFREKNNEIDLSLEYEYKNLTLYANNYFTQTEEEPFKYFNYSSHSTRHTFATMMLTLGADLYTTSKLLGHANVKTTQIYAKIVDSKKVEAVNLVDNVFG